MDKQTGEPYGGFCTCTVGLVIVYKEEAALHSGYSLPNGIASEYLNCIEDPKIF